MRSATTTPRGRFFCVLQVHTGAVATVAPPAVSVSGAVVARRRAATVRTGPTHAENGLGGYVAICRQPVEPRRCTKGSEERGPREGRARFDMTQRGPRTLRMIAGALSRRLNDRRREQERAGQASGSSFFCQPLGGCPCLGSALPQACVFPSGKWKKRTDVRLFPGWEMPKVR